MKLRCPRCGSFVPFQRAEEVVCTVCSFSGPSPGVKVVGAVQFPTAWRPGTGEAAKEQKWVAIREPGDPEPARPRSPGSSAGAPGGPSIGKAGNVSASQASKHAAPSSQSGITMGKAKRGGVGNLPWWVVLILSVLTAGLFGVYWLVRHRKR